MRNPTAILLLGLVVFGLIAWYMLDQTTQPARMGGAGTRTSSNSLPPEPTATTKTPSPSLLDELEQPATAETTSDTPAAGNSQPEASAKPEPAAQAEPATMPEVQWEAFEVPEYGLRFEMPGPVKVSAEEMSMPGGKQIWMRYESSLWNGIGYSVQFNPSGTDKIQEKATDRILDAIQKNLVAGQRGKLIAEKPVILFDRYPGRELTFEVVAVKSRSEAHYYIIDNGLCLMAAVAPIGTPFPPESERFFKSLQKLAPSESSVSEPSAAQPAESESMPDESATGESATPVTP